MRYDLEDVLRSHKFSASKVSQPLARYIPNKTTTNEVSTGLKNSLFCTTSLQRLKLYLYKALGSVQRWGSYNHITYSMAIEYRPRVNIRSCSNPMRQAHSYVGKQLLNKHSRHIERTAYRCWQIWGRQNFITLHSTWEIV